MFVRPSGNRLPKPTRELILGVACELMVTHGFGGMSMRALAQQVGMQPGSLYHYFSCKQDILEAVAEILIAERIQQWQRCKPRSKSPALQLDVFLNVHFGNNVDDRAVQQIVVTELKHLDEVGRDRIKTLYYVYVNELKGIIDRGKVDGVFDVLKALPVAHIILAMLDGVMVYGLSSSKGSDQQSLGDVKVFINKLLGC